jgi:truncated hemoglobin YjbI
MTAAVDAEAPSPLHHETLMDYLDRAAHSMVNTMSDVDRGDRPEL